jgi:hypothetical protein
LQGPKLPLQGPKLPLQGLRLPLEGPRLILACLRRKIASQATFWLSRGQKTCFSVQLAVFDQKPTKGCL